MRVGRGSSHPPQSRGWAESTQPCLVCGRAPSDSHTLRFAQPRALGRKVCDEFTVPVCRLHAPRIADSRDHTAGMFVDNFGLAFWAKVESREHWNKLRMITTARNPIDQCSVGGLRIDTSREDAPWRLQQMSRHWGIGRRNIAAAAQPDQHGRAPTSDVFNRYPAKLRAALSPYSARFRVARERIVVNLIASGGKSSPVMAAAARTRITSVKCVHLSRSMRARAAA